MNVEQDRIMKDMKMLNYIKNVIENKPSGWLNITTHRLDIYEEKLAKTEFLDQFEALFHANNSTADALNALPTAYDYIRLGHPLSCVLEWGIAQQYQLEAANVISFSSRTMPILAILRKNLFAKKNTQIFYTGELPTSFDAALIQQVYSYQFDLHPIQDLSEISAHLDKNASSILITEADAIYNFDAVFQQANAVDFFLNIQEELGSILVVNLSTKDQDTLSAENESYISEIQHVRRRESIAMTPADCFTALHAFVEQIPVTKKTLVDTSNKAGVVVSINEITGTTTKALVASSGLSIQYAILMGLVDNALENHKGKAIKFIVPPNCYGGTNDQARRVAACLDQVEVVDLPVDGGNDMVQSIDLILAKIASEDAVPYIIAEIPTNPRVEVPNLAELKAVLSKVRQTPTGATAIDPVFILDQTFCPNVHFLGEGEMLSTVRTISFASGSKFPSGGLVTSGYCVGNTKTNVLINKIELHLSLCDNEATPFQYEILAKQLPSMNQRISDAYKNTREFVHFITETLPTAKINFVSEELANQGFTPSVFSLDLPTKGNSEEEKEAYKRALNLKLINLMITEIPEESKFCVSYGQLKGCYWTIPATSTQGTTKEGDKDYIVRASLSPNLDLERHKNVFLDFVKSI